MAAPHSELGSSASASPNFWAVIPAGGSGTRLWPLSRKARPKFLLPLFGERSLLQQTTDRLHSLAPASRTLVVCGPSHAAAVARQLPHVPETNVVIEPAPKGTGPALGLAAALIALQDPTAVMGSFAADHHIQDDDAFIQAVNVAIQAAETGHLTTIGLAPSRPETGYGYIERTDEVLIDTSMGKAFRAASFHEKPNLATASSYVESGRFLWNASMFVWRVSTLLDEIARLQPSLHDGLMRIAAYWDSPGRERVTAEVWTDIAENTIDQGIMEHATRVAVVPASMGWSDVGDWHGLVDLLGTTHDDGVRPGVVEVDAHRDVVWAETDRLVALLGIDDVVVVDTPDALLIARRDRAQDVRRIVEHLQERNRSDLL